MTSHTKPHMLLWVDTETTGLDPDRCDLLEIACTITDMRAEQSFDQHHAVIHPDHGIAISHADGLTALRLTAQAQGDDPYTAGHDTDHRATTCIQRDLAEYRERLAHLGETQR